MSRYVKPCGCEKPYVHMLGRKSQQRAISELLLELGIKYEIFQVNPTREKFDFV